MSSERKINYSSLEKHFKVIPEIPTKENEVFLEEKLYAKILNDPHYKYRFDPDNEARKISMARIIAHSIVSTCRELAIPLPSFKVERATVDGCKFVAEDYEVQMSEGFIDSIKNRRMYGVKIRLYMAHECYHAWQWISLFSVMKAEHDKEEKMEGEDYAYSSRSEIAAELFTLKKLLRSPHSFKKPMEFFELMLGVADVYTELQSRKAVRKRYQNRE